MSTRTTLRPEIVLNNVAMTGTVNTTATITQSLTRLAYQISWSGSSPTGTLYLQGSEDYAIGPSGLVSNTGTWTNLYFTSNGSTVSSISISGNTGNGLIDIVTSIYALRLQYVASGGSGNMTVIVSGKVS